MVAMQVKTYSLLGRRALLARTARGVSQKALALSLGVSAARICAIERGRVIGVSTEFVDQLGSLLGLGEDELASLQRAAALDRVMREVIRNLEPEAADVFSGLAYAIGVLDKGRWPSLEVLLRRLARQSEELAALVPTKEEAMQ